MVQVHESTLVQSAQTLLLGPKRSGQGFDPNKMPTIMPGSTAFSAYETVLKGGAPRTILLPESKHKVDNPTVLTQSQVPPTILGQPPKNAKVVEPKEIMTVEGKEYVLWQKLSGGIAEVWMAADPEGTKCIVKKVKKDCNNPYIAQSANNEIFAYIRLRDARHTGKLITAEENEDSIVLVLRFEEGSTLFDAATRFQTFDQKIRIFRKIIDGVEEVHSYNLVHLDLKPNNIMILGDESVKLIDFGISKTYMIETPEGLVLDTEKPKIMMGTLGYGAHEQFGLNEVVGVKADIHALCAIGYFIFSNQNPYFKDRVDNVTMRSLVSKMYFGDRIVLGPDLVPEWLSELLLRGIDRDPNKRPSLVAIKNQVEFLSTG